MRFGIPRYRLPRDILDAEIQRILDMGVELELERTVRNIEDAMREGGFDAAFLAVGAHIGKRAYIPAGSAAKVLDAVSVLRSMEGSDPPRLGRRVVVYGGGNTAMDVARTARRLGAEEAIVVYRRKPRPDARTRLRGRGGARGGRARQVAVDHQAAPTPDVSCSSGWSSTTAASRSRPASSRSWRPTRWCWRSGRRRISRCSTASPASRSPTASCRSTSG